MILPTRTQILWMLRHTLWCMTIVLCLIPVQAYHSLAQTRPFSLPFNLWWGMTLVDAQRLGIHIEEEWTVWDRAQATLVSGVPDPLPNTGSVILVFDNILGLAKIHWAGKPIVQDFMGIEGKAEFRKMKEMLTRQFGVPLDAHEQTFFPSHQEKPNFYLCLQKRDCGQWAIIWETAKGGFVILELIGFEEGAGFVQITYQGPNMEIILKDLHLSQKNNQDI